MMASLFEGDIYNSSDILKEIQAERMIYQINSSTNARKASEKMKHGVEEITKAMENAQKVTQDRKGTGRNADQFVWEKRQDEKIATRVRTYKKTH